MKKSKLIGVIVIALIVIGLIIFVSVYPFRDSHLRVDGIRVRVEEGALLVSECDEENAIYCKKTIEVNGEDQVLEFEFVDFKENGYPNAVRARINGNDFYYEEGLNIEENGSLDYKIFLNFYVIDDLIIFTFTNGAGGRATTLYAIDTEGNVVLAEAEIDEDDMLIKDYTEFITVEDNVITLYASRIVSNVSYHDESVCNADGDAVVEAYYTYTYEDGEFDKELTEEITADEFIDNQGITCTNRETTE